MMNLLSRENHLGAASGTKLKLKIKIGAPPPLGDEGPVSRKFKRKPGPRSRTQKVRTVPAAFR
jgi:hypothetical protein